jgi:predicted anti-sigma-YlaC factor YlaD
VLSVMILSNKTWFITGSESGIGLALVARLKLLKSVGGRIYMACKDKFAGEPLATYRFQSHLIMIISSHKCIVVLAHRSTHTNARR